MPSPASSKHPTPESSVAVVGADSVSLPRARALAEALRLPCEGVVEDPRRLAAGQWLLRVSQAGLAMQQSGKQAPGPVLVDFVGGKLGFRRQRQEATPDLVKAVGLRSGLHPEVWDLTAGLGQDAFILARYGCQVTLFERNPIVRALLADGLARARQFAEAKDAELQAILDRLELVAADSIEVLSGLSEGAGPPVIYIDTMFPERGKSAKVKKSMQLFQHLVGEDRDAERLLSLALGRARNRVVVKRPRHAPSLGGSRPGLSFSGKSVRFDVYPLRKLSA